MVKEKKEREKKGTEEELRKYRLIVESAQDAIFVKDLDGRYILVNQKCLEAFGKSKQEEVLGKRDDELLPPEEAKINIEHDQKVFKTGRPKEVTKKMTAGGKERWFQAKKVPLRDAQGKIIGLVSIARDITERKRVEERIRASEKKYRDLVETTTDWVWEVDRDGVYIYVSPKVKDILGYEVDEVRGKTPFDLMPKDEAKKISKFFREKIIRKEPFFGLENINRHKKGHLVVLETSGIPIMDERGELVGYRGIDRDITERKKMEEMLWKTEEQHKKVIENIFKFVPEGLLVFTDKLALYKKNKAFRDMVQKYSAKLNYTERELTEIIVEKVKNKIITGNNREIRVSKK